jgi:HAD superfamily hydrolase (TIGR01490 family)
MAGTAIFDLDRTITRAPTWTDFLLRTNAARPAFWLRFPGIAARMVGYKLGLTTRDAIKSAGIRSFTGLPPAALTKAGRDFIARRIARGDLRPGAVAAIARHRARGDRLILITAAVDVVAEPLAGELGFDDVICTRIGWSDTGPYLLGRNCYGVEKLRLLDALGPLEPPVYAYSDHISDLDLLTRADHGVAVNPSAALRRAAPAHGLEITDFDRPEPASSPLESLP